MRLLVSLAARLGLKITQLDIETAYLNGKIDTTVYMEVPDLFERMLRRIAAEDKDIELKKQAKELLRKMNDSDVVCKLNKAIYGLRQAGRCWYNELSRVFERLNFKPTRLY